MRKIIFALVAISLGLIGCAGKNGTDGISGLLGPQGPSGNGWIYITANTTWSSDQYLTSSVWIDRNVTLTISPGVTVYSYPACFIDGEGNIAASGTPSQKIRFTKIINSESGGFAFRSKGTNTFNYCIFDHVFDITGNAVIIVNSILKFNTRIGDNNSFIRLVSNDIISNTQLIWGSGYSTSFLSNNFLAYNNGASTICISTNWPTDTNSIHQYDGLSGPIKAPRATPNNP